MAEGKLHYKDYRSADPDDIKVLDLDIFMPTKATIGRRDKEKEVLGAYLLHNYLLYFADEFKPGLAERFEGFTLRKVSEMLGMSVVVAHAGMKNVYKTFTHTENGNDRSLSVIVGSVIMRHVRADRAERGLTGAGVEVGSACSAWCLI